MKSSWKKKLMKVFLLILGQVKIGTRIGNERSLFAVPAFWFPISPLFYFPKKNKCWNHFGANIRKTTSFPIHPQNFDPFLRLVKTKHAQLSWHNRLFSIYQNKLLSCERLYYFYLFSCYCWETRGSKMYCL